MSLRFGPRSDRAGVIAQDAREERARFMDGSEIGASVHQRCLPVGRPATVNSRRDVTDRPGDVALVQVGATIDTTRQQSGMSQPQPTLHLLAESQWVLAGRPGGAQASSAATTLCESAAGTPRAALLSAHSQFCIAPAKESSPKPALDVVVLTGATCTSDEQPS